MNRRRLLIAADIGSTCTGTPSGVGMGRKPPVYLKHGDSVRVEIERIGVLQNVCEVEGA